MGYHYPIDETWSKKEIIAIVEFFTVIERAYEHNAEREEVLLTYNNLKRIVPSKSEEKQLFKEFEQASQYASYPVIQKARKTKEKTIKM